MNTDRFELFKHLEISLKKPDWNPWLNEYVHVDYTGKLKFDIQPPSPDGWSAALGPEDWEMLQQHLQFVADEYFTKAQQFLKEHITKVCQALQTMKVDAVMMILHPSWRACIRPGSMRVFGMKYYYDSHLSPAYGYGRWIMIFPDYERKREEERLPAYID